MEAHSDESWVIWLSFQHSAFFPTLQNCIHFGELGCFSFFFFWPPVKLHFLEFTPHVPAYFVEIILANLLAVGKQRGEKRREGEARRERRKGIYRERKRASTL